MTILYIIIGVIFFFLALRFGFIELLFNILIAILTGGGGDSSGGSSGFGGGSSSGGGSSDDF